MKIVRVRFAHLFAIVTTIGVLACAESSTVARRTGPTIRDSAGIQIVENDSFIAYEMSWTIDTAPSLIIGAQNAGDDQTEAQFHRIKGVSQMRTGQLVIGDWGSRTVRIFDSTGKFLRNLVSTGDGPGELRSVSNTIHLRDDSIFVYNGEAGKLAVFGPDLAYARTVMRVEFSPDSQAHMLYTGVRGAFDDGSLLAVTKHGRGFDYQNDKPGQPWREYADSAYFVRGQPGTPITDVFGWLLDRRAVYSVKERYSYSINMNDLAQPFHATHGTDFYFVDGAKFEARKYSGNGKMQRIIRMTSSPVPVTIDARAKFNDSLTRPPSPATFPRIDAMVIDRAGNLWLATNQHEPGETRRIPSRTWHVFDSTGALQHRVIDHTGLSITEIGDTYILGTLHDADGVESVAKHRLIKR